jgi:hypothetical protein
MDIGVNIALDDYANLTEGMTFILAQTRRNIGIHRSPNKDIIDIHWDETDRLNTITDELEADLLSVSKLLSEEVAFEVWRNQ